MRTATTGRPRQRRRWGWENWVIGAGIALLLLYCLAPFYWMVVSSLKGPGEIASNSLWPRDPTLVNYRGVLGGRDHFGYAVRNSVVIAVTTTLLAMVIAVFSGYALARLRFRGRNLVLALILACSMFPGVAIVTPLYQLFADWGWIDEYQAMIVPNISFALPLAIFVLTTFFREMPWELEEAARVDGCGPFGAFGRIILPLAAPGVVTTGLLVFFAAWNEYLISSVVSITLASNPVTVAIAKFAGDSEFQQPFGSQMAAGVIVTLPLVVLVLLFQRRIVKGLSAGGFR
ncbi:carbohydrate ABC transporter permease [Marinactinospora thermotolerans]|uniref:Multiple sugar transport system permease protein n=1 Tax=Marinactinospora thermotolerans DSM 45154 TaxID=1122192 RepID=A0A1T4RRA9_9ACTN|nr:carbohydrate ABC transporter permease [Marinactinospora thermotolerans]SKA18520.1 multiple sugar transport system permease protein [Marinactinospora thermotolerans DSM 45154]